MWGAHIHNGIQRQILMTASPVLDHGAISLSPQCSTTELSRYPGNGNNKCSKKLIASAADCSFSMIDIQRVSVSAYIIVTVAHVLDHCVAMTAVILGTWLRVSLHLVDINCIWCGADKRRKIRIIQNCDVSSSTPWLILQRWFYMCNLHSVSTVSRASSPSEQTASSWISRAWSCHFISGICTDLLYLHYRSWLMGAADMLILSKQQINRWL